uniref:Uncharacterized protein n=1 Tax=Ciona intestinalis TaxID=7719 RepID=F6W8N6_CIOIN
MEIFFLSSGGKAVRALLLDGATAQEHTGLIELVVKNLTGIKTKVLSFHD